MQSDIDDAALAFLLARAGLHLTDEQKAELKEVYAGIAAMAERVRKPRGHMAEPAHVYDFTDEDLARYEARLQELASADFLRWLHAGGRA